MKRLCFRHFNSQGRDTSLAISELLVLINIPVELVSTHKGRKHPLLRVQHMSGSSGFFVISTHLRCFSPLLQKGTTILRDGYTDFNSQGIFASLAVVTWWLRIRTSVSNFNSQGMCPSLATDVVSDPTEGDSVISTHKGCMHLLLHGAFPVYDVHLVSTHKG